MAKILGVDRRAVLSAAAGGMTLGLGAPWGVAAAAVPQSKTFVLVHGAFHGGWCWRRVADRLERKGHKVYTPTLTGLADRSHLMSGLITLDTHAADVANLIQWEDLKDVVLVGHSYGGFVISLAAEMVPGAIASIVFLDADVPEDGQSIADMVDATGRAYLLGFIDRNLVSRPPPPARSFGILSSADQAWVDAKLTSQPTHLAIEPIRLTGARDRIAKKTYIRAPSWPLALFDRHLEKLKADPSWRTYEIAGGHDSMIDVPDRLTEILLEVA